MKPLNNLLKRLTTHLPAGMLAATIIPTVVLAGAPSYELVRVSSENDQSSTDRYSIECNLTPGVVTQLTQVSGIKSTRTAAFSTDSDTIQRLVDAAPGIARPDFRRATGHTSWWVRSRPGEEARLVRVNLTLANGQHEITQDQSAAGDTLSVFMGINCNKAFGQ